VALGSQDPVEIGAHATRLLEACVQQGQTQLAAGLIRNATEIFSSSLPPRFLLRAGEFLARQGNMRAALDLLDRIGDASPSDPLALRALLQTADIRTKAGDPARARQDLLRVQAHPAYGPEWKVLVEKKLADLARPQPAATGGYRGSRSPSS